ncbi:MAG: hypothetical protein GYA15_09210 [Leptolinea sp.]|jgi:hypothetical protein|nr:hypothetical protein [Leptolinea sp.]
MNRDTILISQAVQNRRLLFFFWLCTAESLFSAGWLISLPSDSGTFTGLSPFRLVLLAIILLPGMLCMLLAFRGGKLIGGRSCTDLLGTDATWLIPACLAAGVLGLTALALLNDLYAGTGATSYKAVAERLAPLLVFFSLLAFQFAGLKIIALRDKTTQFFRINRSFLQTWGWVYGGLLLLVLLIGTTRLGLNADPIGWGKPTVPLLEWQIWLGVLLCLIMQITRNSAFFQKAAAWQSDHPAASAGLISFAIWALAMLVWAGQPVPPGFFATPPRAPNYEIYPFSDAAFYDFHAQSLLIGLGYRGEAIPPRPLYILFLAISHLIAGQDYTRVIFLQTTVLAFFPVTVYWIGKTLNAKTTGLLAAFFIIMREWTSIISTPFTSDVSNSKLLFADLPAALAISLVLLFSLRWLYEPQNRKLGLLTGGLLGISLLIRTQIIILLPVILLFFLFTIIKDRISFRSIVAPVILFLVGFILAVAPWLSRSYRITGEFVFDHPESQTRVVAQRYYPETELTDFDRKPGESTADYTQRLSTAIRQRVFSDPVSVIQFVAAHWLNSEIANLQIFPVRFSITSLSELIKPEHAFWEDWNGQPTPRQTVILLLNLAVLAAGFIYFTRRKFWIGLLPLFFNLAYHFSNAAARNSGWRYLLPADWIFLLYFAAGITGLLSLFWPGRQATLQDSVAVEHKNRPIGLIGLLAIMLGILSIGFTPLAAESVFPNIYLQGTNESIRDLITSSSRQTSPDVQAGIDTLIHDPEAVIMNGRMLYPRFYDAGEGEEKTGKTGYTSLPYARYVFLVAGEPEGTVIFPQTQADLPLRNTGDVILAGCMDGLAVKARLVLLPGPTPHIYLANPPVSWDCKSAP